MDAAAVLVVNASTSQDYKENEYTLNTELQKMQKFITKEK